jgi:hypothetical protein
VTLTVFPQGWIDVAFALTPRNATGSFLELGLGFSLPREMGHLTMCAPLSYVGSPACNRQARRITPEEAEAVWLELKG